jgi:hypothetical protein
VLTAAKWDHQGSELQARVVLHPTTTNAFIQVATLNLKEANQELQAAMEERYRSLCEPGIAAEKAGHFAQAVHEFERVVALFPKQADARLRLKRNADAQKDQEQYRADLSAARDALGHGNVDAARAAVERLKTSRFADSQLLFLEKDIAAQARTAKANTALKEAEALLDTNLALAHVRLEAACKLNPGSRDTASAFAAVTLLLEVEHALATGDQRLRDQRPELVQPALAKPVGRLLDDVKLPIWRVPPYAARRERLLQDSARLCKKATNALTSAAASARQSADNRVAQNPSDAAADYETALGHLQQAKALLTDMQRITGDKSIAADLRDIDTQTFELQASMKRVGGLALIAKGNKALQQAKDAINDARVDPTTIPTAGAVIAKAMKFFREAEELDKTAAAKHVRIVEDLRDRLDRILHPVALDPAKELSRADWSYQKDRWNVKEVEGKSYLQVEPGEPAVLDSTSRDWPADFELVLDFAVVDSKGRAFNRLLSSQVDPVTLVLYHTNGTNTSIVLGKDNSNPLQPLARLQYNREQHTIEGMLAPAGPMRLTLRCQKRSGEKRTLAVLLGDREICVRPFPQEVQSVRLRIAPVTTAQPRYVAIFGLDAAWTGGKEAKAP